MTFPDAKSIIARRYIDQLMLAIAPPANPISPGNTTTWPELIDAMEWVACRAALKAVLRSRKPRWSVSIPGHEFVVQRAELRDYLRQRDRIWMRHRPMPRATDTGTIQYRRWVPYTVRW